MVRKAIGTVTRAGRASNSPGQPGGVRPNRLSDTAPAEVTPPSTRPATAPTSVSPRHQMPSTSIGQKVDAATAKASDTVWEKSNRVASSASPSGTSPATTAASRKSRTPARGNSDWLVDSTPATPTTSPDEVDRNAAQAPAATNPASRVARVP